MGFRCEEWSAVAGNLLFIILRMKNIEREHAPAPKTSSPDYMRMDDVAKMLSISKMTVTRWVAAGRIPHYQTGRIIRLKRDDVLRFVEGTRRGTMDERELEMRRRRA